MRNTMLDPFGPEVCEKTGRLLTEWFEDAEYDKETEKALAKAQLGLPDEWEPDAGYMWREGLEPEEQELMRKYFALVSRRAKRKWKYFMSKDEIAWRMNEASKIVNPDNFKFLPPEVQERTGLELNPLWQLELLVRSGTLSPKEQVAALKELAGYTHSKAPTLNQNTNINLKHEDFLLELAKEEYSEVIEVKPEAHILQPRETFQPKHRKQALRRKSDATAAIEHQEKELTELLSEFPEGDLDLEEFLKDVPPES